MTDELDELSFHSDHSLRLDGSGTTYSRWDGVRKKSRDITNNFKTNPSMKSDRWRVWVAGEQNEEDRPSNDDTQSCELQSQSTNFICGYSLQPMEEAELGFSVRLDEGHKPRMETMAHQENNGGE